MVFRLRGDRAAGLASRRTSMVGAAKNETPGQCSISAKISAGAKWPLSGITLSAPAAECGGAGGPGAVRQRRRVQDRVAGAELIDVREVRLRLEQQVAMRQRRALGHPGRAARIEKPRRIVGFR